MNGEIQQQIGNESANFILRRAMPFSKSPIFRGERLKSREEAAPKCDDYERSSTLEDRSRRCGSDHQVVNDGRDSKMGKDVGHKTVIYFGDSNPRRREDRARQQPSPEATSRCKNEDPGASLLLRPRNDEILGDSMDQDDEKNDAERRDSVTENGDPKVVHEIVVNVSPSREDVLRIEEDESQLEDYWSLPGDTSGFKADWSFVQQWRLRG